jgi:hypothetical protein
MPVPAPVPSPDTGPDTRPEVGPEPDAARGRRPVPAPRPTRRTSRRPAPRGGVDPLERAEDALVVFESAARPYDHEILGILLDLDGIGDQVIVITGTRDPDSVIEVGRAVAAAASRSIRPWRWLVLASGRPDSGTLPGDVDRWLEVDSLVRSYGVELVDWFVIGPAGAECPRELIGEPDRWPPVPDPAWSRPVRPDEPDARQG